MPSLADKTVAPAQADDTLRLPKEMPAFPVEAFSERTDYARRTQALNTFNDAQNAWWDTVNRRLTLGTQGSSTVINNQTTVTKNLRLSVGELTVAIEEVNELIIDETQALARKIVTVSALAGSSSHIVVSSTAPVGPALNDLWVDNSDIGLPITYKWNGTDWVEVTEPISVAAVAAEQTARIAADGFLSSKYTLTVIAGNVVTGMNITSSTGGGVNISSVIFRATDFLIYNGVTGQIMFDVSGTTVRLGGTLVVNTAGNKVYIGAGNYNAADTAFFVNSAGFFSLKDKLTWDPGTNALTITGTITSTSGTIGGFTIGATELSAGAGSTTVRLSANVSTGIRLGDPAGAETRYLKQSVTMFNNSHLEVVSLNTNSDDGVLNLNDTAGNPGVVIAGGGASISFGSSLDTNLYRSGANILRTDDDFSIGGSLRYGAVGAIGAFVNTGYIDFIDSGGTPRKLAVVS